MTLILSRCKMRPSQHLLYSTMKTQIQMQINIHVRKCQDFASLHAVTLCLIRLRLTITKSSFYRLRYRILRVLLEPAATFRKRRKRQFNFGKWRNRKRKKSNCIKRTPIRKYAIKKNTS